MFDIFIIALVVLFFVFKGKIKKLTTKVSFENKTVWITGASSGLGEEMAKQFADKGATVILSSRKEQELMRVKNSLKNSDKHYVLPLDMSKSDEVIKKTQLFVQALEKDGKKLDIVIENAGCSQRALCIDTSFETHEYITQLNYHGPVAHTKGFIDHMIKNKGGQIVVISSVAGKLTPGIRTSYVGSKHAVSGFFDSLRAELYNDNISVTQIYPGYVQTNISKNAMTGKGTESLGKTDTNIAGGMSVVEFGKIALYNIFIKEKDIIVSTDFKHHFGTWIRQLFPNFVAAQSVKNMQNQLNALKKAQ